MAQASEFFFLGGLLSESPRDRVLEGSPSAQPHSLHLLTCVAGSNGIVLSIESTMPIDAQNTIDSCSCSVGTAGLVA